MVATLFAGLQTEGHGRVMGTPGRGEGSFEEKGKRPCGEASGAQGRGQPRGLINLAGNWDFIPEAREGL